MIIGSGLIGTEMKKIDTDDILIFCSGPSVSIETSQKSFQREIDLFDNVTRNFEYNKVIYFSSLPHLDNKVFLTHKKNMENKIKGLNKEYIIVRPPSVIGKNGNPNNVIPFFINSIKKSLPIDVYEIFRSVLDVRDLRRIVEYLLLDGFTGKITINYIELFRAEYILFMLSEILGKSPVINKYIVKLNRYSFDINTFYVSKILRELSIGQPGYTDRILRNYVRNYCE